MAVEFALTLVYMIFFMLAFFQIAMLFISQQRITYAAYIGARSSAVDGNAPSAMIDAGARGAIAAGRGQAELSETLRDLPIDFYDIYNLGGHAYEIKASASLPYENPLLRIGDNR